MVNILQDIKSYDKFLQFKFGKIIRGKRVQMNLSQEEISEKVGITETYLRSLERGDFATTWIKWLKLCDALDINVYEMQNDLFNNIDHINHGDKI